MLRLHDFERFGLRENEKALHYTAFDVGMEGLLTDRRFLYRDTVSSESWAIPLRDIFRIVIHGFDVFNVRPLNWDIYIWTREPLDPDEPNSDRERTGDLTLSVVDWRQAIEFGARLAEAIEKVRPPLAGS